MPDFDNLTPEQIVDAIQWSNLAKKVLADKKTKTAFEGLIKQVAPEVQTSEDIAEPVLAPYKAQIAELKDQVDSILNGAAEYNKQEQINALRKAKYQPDAIEKILQISKDEGIKNLMHAAAVFDKTNPPVRANEVGGITSLNFGNDIFGLQENTKEILDLLFNDPDAFINQQVNAVSQEFNNQE